MFGFNLKMKKLLIIFPILLLFGFDLSKSAEKKIDKTIAALWPDAHIEKLVKNLSPEQQKKLSFTIENNSLYFLLNNNKSVGYIFLSKAKGKSDLFDYMIVFKPDLSILTIQLLVYREEYGEEIGSKRWLKQFYGKQSSNDIKFGENIQNISGATISSKSITNDIKKSINKMQELQQKGFLK